MSDFIRNKNNTKGLVFIFLFRISNFFTTSLFLRILGFPFRVFYRLFVQWILGIDIPDSTSIGSGLVVYHGIGLIISSKTVIGRNVTLRHNTTIGNSKSGGNCPVINDNVNVGAHCVIIGNVVIGENAIIGAGAVVVQDVPIGAVVVGNPARILKL